MAFENLNNNHYLPKQKIAINYNLAELETSLIPRIKNLNPEEHQKYGSVDELNKLVVNKVKDYKASQPNSISPDVDWEESQNDFDSREFIQATIARLQNMIDGLSNNKILHDFDNYQAALTDYDYNKYKAATKAAGFENKINEVGQFFNKTGTVATIAKTTDPTSAS